MNGDPDPLALGLLILREDLQFGRIPAAQRSIVVEGALEDGRRVAESARARWGRDPQVIARACDVSVIESDDASGFGTTLVFAEYTTRPPTITLYRPAMARLDHMLAAPEVAARFGMRSARSALIAHELYHHFDCTGAQGPIARRHPVTVLQFGRWRWTSGLRSLSEIAAGSFVQTLLELPVPPKLLDLLLTANRTPALSPRQQAGSANEQPGLKV